MTAVELLVSKIASKIDNEYWCNQQNITEYVKQAKEMHKAEKESLYTEEEFKKAVIDAYHINPQEAKWKNIGINYYNETFKKD